MGAASGGIEAAMSGSKGMPIAEAIQAGGPPVQVPTPGAGLPPVQAAPAAPAPPGYSPWISETPAHLQPGGSGPGQATWRQRLGSLRAQARGTYGKYQKFRNQVDSMRIGQGGEREELYADAPPPMTIAGRPPPAMMRGSRLENLRRLYGARSRAYG